MYMGGVGEAYRNSSAICLQTYKQTEMCARVCICMVDVSTRRLIIASLSCLLAESAQACLQIGSSSRAAQTEAGLI